MNLTQAQSEAIAARGNVLVIAGAGTGKTRTLVERSLTCLLEEKPPASFEDVLLVTFTEAAAAEMRQRIRASLERQLEPQPGHPRLRELLALFETAQIGTIHSFCLKLIRQHFYELELDPQLAVLSQEEGRLLAEETLDELLNRYYSSEQAEGKHVQELVQIYGRGSDKVIRALVLRLHEYTQTLPDPSGWFDRQSAIFGQEEPVIWREWLESAISDWCGRWLRRLERMTSGNSVASGCARAVGSIAPVSSATECFPKIFEQIGAAVDGCPRGKKTAWVAPLKDFLEDAAFLHSICPRGGKCPLTEDWGWVRAQMRVFLELTREFTSEFSDGKRELGVVDFHDLEQHALRLLWDPINACPKPIAQEWRKRLRFVFVDEYQDINAAQDKIIECVSRAGPLANRFLVGDLKQSIYRFRLADPAIFQGYVQQWVGAQGRTIPLVENFRSREGILNFVNSVFRVLMRREVGGVDYDATAALQFGTPANRQALSAAATGPCVELNLLFKQRPPAVPVNSDSGEGPDGIQDLLDAEREARLLAMRLLALKTSNCQVFEEGAFRSMCWKDVAILLRSPANKAESYAKEFSRQGIPLTVARAGFYQSLEVSDVLSLLQLLDNPLQDIPLIAVLRSPMVGLSLADLVAIRLATRGRFWLALNRWHEARKPVEAVPDSSAGRLVEQEAGTSTKEGIYEQVDLFLRRFRHWRRLARQSSLSRCLEALLDESHYAAWLLTQPKGEQRHTNVLRLVDLARQFDRFQRQSLFRFLRFVEAQQQAQTEPEIAADADEDAVRLLSIHQSKGLEFPIVAVADLGKAFNLSDLRADLILDEQSGLCPLVKPPQTGRRYPSLPYWLARQRQTRELLGEELRLLYVAMTRARDLLLLSGTVAEKRFFGEGDADAGATVEEILEARSYADWVGLWFRGEVPQSPAPREGENLLLRWKVHADETLAINTQPQAPGQSPAAEVPPEFASRLTRLLDWKYPFLAATLQSAKGSVTGIRRELADEESLFLFGGGREKVGQSLQGDAPAAAGSGASRRGKTRKKPSAAEIGSANHSFLQLMSLDGGARVEDMKLEASRLQNSGVLTPDQAALIDFPGVARFWTSPLGDRIRRHAASVCRELPFTARFLADELAAVIGKPSEPTLMGEFVVIQGVADLVVLLKEEIWLVDFKTDQVDKQQMAERLNIYRPQLALYAAALSGIYHRPVTERWLYFLGLGEPVALHDSPPSIHIELGQRTADLR